MSANNYQYRLYLQTESFLGFVENSESDWYDEDEDLDLDDEDADDDLESDEDWENRELYLHRVGDAWCLESIQIQVTTAHCHEGENCSLVMKCLRKNQGLSSPPCSVTLENSILIHPLLTV